MEQRKANRYRLCLPVLFSWTDPTGVIQQSSGFTRDIGMHGVYVSADFSPPLGSCADLEILLPISPSEGLRTTRLKAHVRVIRSLTEGAERGFAANGDIGQIDWINNALDGDIASAKTHGGSPN